VKIAELRAVVQTGIFVVLIFSIVFGLQWWMTDLSGHVDTTGSITHPPR